MFYTYPINLLQLIIKGDVLIESQLVYLPVECKLLSKMIPGIVSFHSSHLLSMN